MSSPQEILALFEREMRRDPIPPAGSRVERVGPIVRIVGRENCILFSDLDDSNVRRVVAEQVEFFRRRAADVEWKLYGYDRPEDLASILERAGFVPEEWETVLVFDLGEGLPASAPLDGIEIRPVGDEAGVRDAILARDAAFGPGRCCPPVQYEELLRDPNQVLFVAYVDGRPIASGRLERAPGRMFASLWGGGTVPTHRHRGVYRGLVAARAALAKREGSRFLSVEARAGSRPILERLGFVPLTSTRGWVLKPVAEKGSRSTR
jgi:hypothetical protein